MTAAHAPPDLDHAVPPPAEELDSVSMGPGGRLIEQAAERLRRRVPYDGSAWFGTDPATVLPTSPVRIENVPTGGCEAYWDGEFAGDDVLLFRDLARSQSGGGTLYDATGSLPARSRRYRELLGPRGFGDELRAALRIGTSTWAVVDLFRARGRNPFTAADLQAVQLIGSELAFALAGLATSDHDPDRSSPDDSPGTALFDDTGALCSLDEQAGRWLGELTNAPWGEPATHPLMAPIWSILARARAVAERREHGPASARLRGAGGRWIMLHASCLRRPDGSPGLTALVIEPASSSQIAPLIVAAYGLTRREQQVTSGAARGLSNAGIADELFVSVHTVRDHLKVVFAKLAVTTRGELIAKIFAEQYGPAGSGAQGSSVHLTL